MARKELDARFNQINQMLADKVKEARDLNLLTPELHTQLNTAAANARDRATKEMGDGLQQLNSDVPQKISIAPPISTNEIQKPISGDAFKSKIAAALKGDKKLAGIIPFAGAGIAALSGDPAMAAEELATDAAGPAGLAYEAIRPGSVGNPEEEQLMLAERDAKEAYEKSPARFSRLNKLLGR